MSILQTFDPGGTEIIRPQQLVAKPEHFPEVLVSAFSQSVTEIAAGLSGAAQIDELRAGMSLPIIGLRWGGKTIGVYQSLVGGAASAGLLEEVLAKGAKKVVFFGSCGALDETATAGSLVVPTAAYRDEGTSYHYMWKGSKRLRWSAAASAVRSRIRLPKSCIIWAPRCTPSWASAARIW